MTKKELRKIYKSVRDAIEDDRRKSYSNSMIDFLINSEIYENAKRILVYSSFGSEVILNALIEKAKMDGKSIFYPICKDGGIIDFYEVENESQLVDGHYGIKEPTKNLEKYKNSSPNDMVIVPGLAFDKSGYRLGYGGGYYDRFLPYFCGVSVGLVFSELLVDSLPHDKYDMPVNMIFTEKGEIDEK